MTQAWRDSVGVETKLGRVAQELSAWRARHGGRGRAIPAALWLAASEVAAVAGVEVTARTLGVDRKRLARRVAGDGSTRQTGVAARSTPGAGAGQSRPAFVEVDARQVFAQRKTVIRLFGGAEGAHLELEVEASAMDVVAMARALWEQAR